jgi:hypothetical protein
MNSAPAYDTSEGLRALLVLLHSGEVRWSDSEAEELMAFTMTKYGALARKHGQEPSDAAVAAFEVLRTRAAREAFDPWAVVTRAVQLTLTYEARANGLLCSTARARRSENSAFHDAERFSDRETAIYEYHPAFQVEQLSEIEAEPASDQADESTNAFVAVDRAIEVFTNLGWPRETARAGIEYICNRLMRTGSRLTAFEYLRRDRHAQALLDLDQRCWLALLRAVLGIQHPDREQTNAGRGVLMLLLIGHEVNDVVAMPDIKASISRGARALADGGRHV